MISEPRVRLIVGELGRCLDRARAAQAHHAGGGGAVQEVRRSVPTGRRRRLNVALVAEEGAGLETLRMLEESEHRVAMVLTSPPGAQRALIWSHAAEKGHRLLPAQRVRDPAFAQVVRDEQIDLLLSVHSLHILKAPILDAPRLGAFNMHPGPLPRYAGLCPSSWAIYRGEVRHGVTIHRMLPGIDTGPIAYQTIFDLHEDDTGLSVTLRCVREGVKLMARLLETAATDPDAIPRIDQDLSQREYFGREIPEGGVISWARPAREVHRFFRAFSYDPYPSPWGYPRTTLGGREVAIVELSLTGEPADALPGTVARGSGPNVRVACADAWLTLSLARIDGETVEPARALEPGVRLGDG
jgi:methionyl-tRNA formyltransferase